MMRDYTQTIARLTAICAQEDDDISIMATIAQELFDGFEGFDWVGFYRVVAPSLLKIGPYQGGHGCLVIPFDKGVCGAAARTAQTQLVDDVHQFEGHIACSPLTRSELVIPVFDHRGQLRAVLDLDSNQPRFFTAEDGKILQALMTELFASCWQGPLLP
jgi:L-methionine (R)-S-oxide reductase